MFDMVIIMVRFFVSITNQRTDFTTEVHGRSRSMGIGHRAEGIGSDDRGQKTISKCEFGI